MNPVRTPAAPGESIDLERIRSQAKALLKAAKSGDAGAIRRIDSVRPAASSKPPLLADALHALSREMGFPSWPKLKIYARTCAKEPAHLRIVELDRGWYFHRAIGLLSQHESRLPEAAVRQIEPFHPRFAGMTPEAIFDAKFTIDDALLVTAREHGFVSWESLMRHLTAVSAGLKTEPFYLALQAIKAGDIDEMERWLDKDPSLIHARGSNGNTLLNLAVGTGHADAARALIARGADIEADNVRGWTPLHSAAYGGQTEMIRMLLAAAARADRSALGDGGTPLVMALFWGKRAAADLLAAERGVLPTNLRAAAGAGRLDIIDALIDSCGRPAPEAGAHRAFYRPHSGFPVWSPSDEPQEIVDEALTYAARNLRMDTVDLLLARGARIDADPYRGTALTWVASLHPPDAEEADLQLAAASHLLDRGADVNCVNTFGGPTHGDGVTALHLAAQANNRPMAELLLSRGADPSIPDRIYHSTPAGWARHFGYEELASVIERGA